MLNRPLESSYNSLPTSSSKGLINVGFGVDVAAGMVVGVAVGDKVAPTEVAIGGTTGVGVMVVR